MSIDARNKPDEPQDAESLDLTGKPTQMGGKGLFKTEDSSDDEDAGFGANMTMKLPSLSKNSNDDADVADFGANMTMKLPSLSNGSDDDSDDEDFGADMTMKLPSLSKDSGAAANVPLSGDGSDSAESQAVPAARKIHSVRGLRSVARDAEPINKLREVSFDQTREVALAQMFFNNGLITKIQLCEAIDKLNSSSKNFGSLVPISALFELQEIELVNMDRLINFLVTETKTPFVSLKCFRIDNDAFTKLPPDIAERLGVVLFGVVGHTCQVALLNPVDKTIRTAICEYLGNDDVSFFIVKPDEISSVYDKLRAQLSGVAEE